jgi:YVTN family beta-propeller protein
MPVNDLPLSRNEVIAIKNWIETGCPNKFGIIPFSSNALTRNKTYITNQGCDLVSIVDAETNLVMRTVRVGKDPALIEQPHNIKVSADGKYWYVCFSNGSYFQKFDAVSDTLLAEVNIGFGKWNVVLLANDQQTAFVSDFSSIGRIVEVDIQSMTVKKVYASGLFSNPHGMAASLTDDTIYVTAQYGNMIYRIIRSIPQVDAISLQTGLPPVLTPNFLDPHEVIMNQDRSQYLITCQASDEVRVMDAKTDTLLKVIPVGDYPLEMSISKKRNLLFVTCQEDINPIYPFFKGSVYVIDLSTLNVVKKIYEKFYQPHGIGVDDFRNVLYVSSTNSNPSGPAPHHVSECAGRNGFFHVIDMEQWTSLKPASELSVFPYSLSVRE